MKSKQIPTEVLFLGIAKRYGIPVGIDTYNKIYKYPEYFPEECERKRKWDSIPDNVRKMYDDEMSAVLFEEWHSIDKSEGPISIISDPEKHTSWIKEREARSKVRVEREREIREKYLRPYGL